MKYDRNDIKSIESYAKLIIGKTVRQIIGDAELQYNSGKGKIGQIVEKYYFNYTPNQVSEPDFKEVGLELKTTPLKKNKKGFVAKERLVLNIIDYKEEYKKTFETSSFWLKNNLLLLIFYLYEEGKFELDFIFKLVRVWQFPPEDLKIIKDDWIKIINKIKEGKAHEISEGDTLYLSACTKGANKSSLRDQPFSGLLAKQRAFSLKQKYLNFIIEDSSKYDNEPIIKSIDDYLTEQTFESFILDKFMRYYGFSEEVLKKELILSYGNKAKNKFELISKAILGVRSKNISEFEKADILMKTVRIDEKYRLKESMSFKQIDYKNIINETWEDSTWYRELNRRFLFVVYQSDHKNVFYLKKAFFWSIPNADMEILQNFVWLDTQRKILDNKFDNFVKSSENKIGHVRPKAKNSFDLAQTTTGLLVKKKCFWLNRAYIEKICRNNIFLNND